MAKKKVKKNIAGLWNQSQSSSHVEEAANDGTEAVETPPTYPAMKADLDDNKDWDTYIRFDSNKPCWESEDNEEQSEDDSPDNDGIDVEDKVMVAGNGDWRNEGLYVSMMVLAIDNGDDP